MYSEHVISEAGLTLVNGDTLESEPYQSVQARLPLFTDCSVCMLSAERMKDENKLTDGNLPRMKRISFPDDHKHINKVEKTL